MVRTIYRLGSRIVALPSVMVAMLRDIEPQKRPRVRFNQPVDGMATRLRSGWTGKYHRCPGQALRPRCTGLIVHDLGHSAIRNLVKTGVPERVAMKISRAILVSH